MLILSSGQSNLLATATNRIKIELHIKTRVLPVPTFTPGQGGQREQMRPKGNQAGHSPLDEGFFHGWICS